MTFAANGDARPDASCAGRTVSHRSPKELDSQLLSATVAKHRCRTVSSVREDLVGSGEARDSTAWHTRRETSAARVSLSNWSPAGVVWRMRFASAKMHLSEDENACPDRSTDRAIRRIAVAKHLSRALAVRKTVSL